MLTNLIQRLSDNEPRCIDIAFDRAAILLALTNEAEPQLVFTRRSSQLKTHGGQVAFPGGKAEPGDTTLLDTALRESEEEIGLNPLNVKVLGRLSEVISRYEILVTPYVGLIDPQTTFVPDEREIESVFTVPVKFFLECRPARVDQLGYKQFRASVPCWMYGEYQIWGMSAMVLVDFLAVGFGHRWETIHDL